MVRHTRVSTCLLEITSLEDENTQYKSKKKHYIGKHVCVWVCMCVVCMCVCVYACCVYVYMCVVYVCMCVRVYVCCVYVCMCVCMLWICVCMLCCVYMCMCVCVYVCVCVYMCMYMCCTYHYYFRLPLRHPTHVYQILTEWLIWMTKKWHFSLDIPNSTWCHNK